jgi:hypothetical protein
MVAMVACLVVVWSLSRSLRAVTEPRACEIPLESRLPGRLDLRLHPVSNPPPVFL